MLPQAAARHSSTQVSSVITITGTDDHDPPEFMITINWVQ